MSWPGRPDPEDTYRSEEESDHKDSSTFFEDDILSESDNDLDIDASHILGEEMSLYDDDSNGADQSIHEEDKDTKFKEIESSDQSEQDSVEGDSLGRRIDPSAHEASRYDDRYSIKPDPYSYDDDDDKPDPFNEEKKEDPYNEETIGNSIGEDYYNDYNDDHDIENPSISFRTFGFDNEKNDENSSGSFNEEGSFEDMPSKTESRGSSGIEVEEIIEFGSSYNKEESLNRDAFDDEPKAESNATVQTSRERRIITFLSVFVCCLVLLLAIAIAVGIGLGVNKNKESQPIPTSPPTFPPSNAPTVSPTSAPTLQVTTLKPSLEPSASPTLKILDTISPSSRIVYPTISPTNAPVTVIAIPTTKPTVNVIDIPSTSPPVNEPSPIGGPPEDPANITPSTDFPTKTSTTSPDSQNSALSQLLIANSLDGGEAVMKDGTPQNKAYKWLLKNAFLSIYTDAKILSRYSLATFFYATNGPTTWDSFIRDNGWLTDAPECEWGSTANDQCTKGVYTSLTLDFVGVSGTIPQELGLLIGLERFSVRGSTETADIMSGTIPDIFGTLSNMQTVRLNDNDLEGSIPVSIGSMKNCMILILSGNSLVGKIPPELAETRGRTLNLDNNQLSGKIPSELFALTELKILNLQNNNLSGMIPSEIGYATSISNINFSNNQLGGSIPSEIGNLVEIRSAINFSSNQLSGEIPSEIGRLNKMRNFEVQNNLLAGSIPTNLSGLINIELFRIENNAGITGSLPESVCVTFDSISAITYSGCGLESFECDCCTYCCEGGVCECNVADADICGEDLTGVRAPLF